jgi:hypothetical protein
MKIFIGMSDILERPSTGAQMRVSISPSTVQQSIRSPLDLAILLKHACCSWMAWCAQAVFDAANELKQATVGAATAGASERETGLEHARIASHLETAADTLDLAAIAREVCTVAAERLRELAAETRKSSNEDVNLETIERYLDLLEEDLFAALIASAPEDLKVSLKERATRELMPFRLRLSADQLRQVERKYIQKQMLAHYNIPRFSLFYMGKQ